MSKATSTAVALAAIQIVTVGPAVHLGILETGKDSTTLKDSMLVPNGQVTKKTLADYLCAENLGTLSKPIEVTGQVTFSRQDLPDDLALEFQILKLKFTQAQGQAVQKVVNAEFKSLIGG